MTEKAVFLDRDGVLHRERGFIHRPDQIELLPGTVEALGRLRELGYHMLVVSNQSGIARGLLDFGDLQAVHAHLVGLTQGLIDGFYVCPHHPTEGSPPLRRDCPCRKPEPGLLHQAAKEWSLDFESCWLVGDAPRDIEAAAAAEVRSALLLGPKVSGLDDYPATGPRPELVISSLGELADRIAG